MPSKRKPDWNVSTPVKSEGQKGKTYWTRCGVGFNNSDTGKGESISIRLKVQAASGDYVLFPYESPDKGGAEAL
ncbi:MAG: hypothetical protein IPJ69_03710 [Deltaproteobacteria bacterium]|nr:MAG: hypothetical protein IPJ69_03710 [Deltaproteobacteria bacterium]